MPRHITSRNRALWHTALRHTTLHYVTQHVRLRYSTEDCIAYATLQHWALFAFVAVILLFRLRIVPKGTWVSVHGES